MSTDSGAPTVRRRDFLKVLGAAGAATATVGCSTGDVEKLIPYVNHPDNTVPSVSTYYATTCRECAAGCGVIGETREGHVHKLEGNVEHPVNRGALCARGQAALQGVYNPDRYRQPMMRRVAGGPLEPVTWPIAIQRFTEILGEVRRRGDAGRAAFINRAESGSFPAFLDQWLAGFGMPAHYAYDPEAPDAVVAANRQAYGAAWPTLDFKASRLVVSFGADFLDNWGPTVPLQLDWADARAQLENAPRMVYVGPRRTLTGLNADQWIACRPGTELVILNALRGTGSVAAAAEASGVTVQEIETLRTELESARPSMVLAGGWQANGTELALAAAQLNQSLGNVGTTIRPQGGFTAYDRTDSFAVFRDLVGRMNAGGVSLLMLRNADLAHDLPQGLGVEAAIRKVPYRVSFSTYPDQTSELCDLILPDSHPLESWGDAEPIRGTIALQQPAADPVFDTRQTADVLFQAQAAPAPAAAPGVATPAPTQPATTQTWRNWLTARFPGGAEGLIAALPRGVASGSTLASAAPARTVGNKAAAPAFEGQQGDMFLVVYPSSVLGFGQGANKPWLQELPDPVTKTCWQTVAELHPMTAKRLGVDNGDLVTVKTAAGSLTLPVYIYMGVRPDVVAVMAGRGHKGDGREYWDARKRHMTGYGRYADGVGENAMVLVTPGEDRQSGGMALQTAKATLTRTGERIRVVTTEGSARQHGRGIGQAVTVAELANLHQREGTSADQFIPQADAGEPSAGDGGEPGRGSGAPVGPRKGVAAPNAHAGGTTESHGEVALAQEAPTQGPDATTPSGGALKGGEQAGTQDAEHGGGHVFIGDASHDFLPGLRSPVANDAQGDLGDPASKDKGMYDLNHWSGMARRRWAMTIDLARCTGCSACVTACYAENNLPTVGHKDQGPVFLPDRTGFGANITRSREMSWLRVERYYEGNLDTEERFSPEFDTRFVPMGCQHCGNAPCEPVCPVYATYHSPDGLNVQVYNRCVGTRYCSNNCPYKVRYFNWFGYGEPDRPQYAWPEPMHMLLNPEVTVRGKGVMEKCTFCVQRIRETEHRAKLEGRPVAPDEFTTACAQACPSRAIVFGDAADAGWTVSQLAIDRRAYHVFAELNTYTAVVYLKKVNHPGAGQEAHGAQGAPASAGHGAGGAGTTAPAAGGQH